MNLVAGQDLKRGAKGCLLYTSPGRLLLELDTMRERRKIKQRKTTPTFAFVVEGKTELVEKA